MSTFGEALSTRYLACLDEEEQVGIHAVQHVQNQQVQGFQSRRALRSIILPLDTLDL